MKHSEIPLNNKREVLCNKCSIPFLIHETHGNHIKVKFLCEECLQKEILKIKHSPKKKYSTRRTKEQMKIYRENESKRVKRKYVK